MKFSEKQIESIRQSGLLRARQRKLSDDELHDVFENNAPCVESYTAEQDKGAYSVNIRGVPGAYYVETMESDNDGVFDDVDSARAALMSNFGEFLVDEKDAE
jgi:hypothetical protein